MNQRLARTCASNYSARAATPDEFMFASGPVRRYVGQPVGRARVQMRGEDILAGGPSGVSGDPWSINLLGRWLTNDTYRIRQRVSAIQQAAAEKFVFEP